MGMIWLMAAALWGLAEATFFFIVPDVLLTAWALRFGIKGALRASAIAALFASLGGLALWLWGASDAAAAREAMLDIPAIGPDLIARAASDMASAWPVQLFLCAVTGVPYKLYAVEAGALHLNLAAFLLASFVARFARFALTVG